MEVGKDAILRVVKAARIAMKISAGVRMMSGADDTNQADVVFGLLADALYDVIDGKEMKVGEDFGDSEVVRLMENTELSESETTDDLLKLYEQNHPAMPKPNLVSRDKLNEMLGNCGYRPTAEGEWSR